LAYTAAALVAMAAAFFVSIYLSKDYWGYWFKRPGLFAEIDGIARVTALIPVTTRDDSSGKNALVVDDRFSTTQTLAGAARDPYYCLEARILLRLREKQLLPATPAASLSGLPPLYPLVVQSGLLASPEPGYEHSAEFGGVAVDAVDASGTRLVFLGLRGGQLENDHYPYYGLLFSGCTDSSALSLIRGQRFFYDVAGMEMFEWHTVFRLFSVAGVGLGFFVLTGAMVFWRGVVAIRGAHEAARD
jgi:hypothetical protein